MSTNKKTLTYQIHFVLCLIVVIVDYVDSDKKRQARKVFFSTGTTMSARDIFDIYRTRFQLEFVFRDAKQFTGLTHCQARNKEALSFAFNASLSSNWGRRKENRSRALNIRSQRHIPGAVPAKMAGRVPVIPRVLLLESSLVAKVAVLEAEEIKYTVQTESVDGLAGIGYNTRFSVEGDAESGL